MLEVPEPETKNRRDILWRIIFLSDTKAGRRFDMTLLAVIGLSVFTLMMESVDELREPHATVFAALEWTFTGLFTVEYIARLWCVKDRLKYATSFFGVVDLLSILPSFIELLVPGTHYLMMLRVLRLMRMFRVLKMAEYLGEASILINALIASRRKITVFMTTVLSIVFVEGTVVYVLERDANPDFSNIPQAIYWAIVTLTTVGYGDVTPVTVLGKIMASMIMMTGFAIIAVPTGIVTYEISREIRGRGRAERQCGECGWRDHAMAARFCQQCGTALEKS